MIVVRTTEEVRRFVRDSKISGKSVGFVPTMGALHGGHAALIRRSANECDETIVSIFVNPLQFNDKADLENYPRTFEADRTTCIDSGAGLVYLPEESDLYPVGFDTRVEPGALGQSLEGAGRPGHFSGMATVVLKLLNVVGADRAYFGKKDFQQLSIVRRMVSDFNLPIRIVGCPTVRDHDGLALSSRNALLSPSDRLAAAVLNRALRGAVDRLRSGSSCDEALRAAHEALDTEPCVSLEYLSIVDKRTLVAEISDPANAVVLVAARIGSVRLIDNMEVTPDDD